MAGGGEVDGRARSKTQKEVDISIQELEKTLSSLRTDLRREEEEYQKRKDGSLSTEHAELEHNKRVSAAKSKHMECAASIFRLHGTKAILSGTRAAEGLQKKFADLSALVPQMQECFVEMANVLEQLDPHGESASRTEEVLSQSTGLAREMAVLSEDISHLVESARKALLRAKQFLSTRKTAATDALGTMPDEISESVEKIMDEVLTDREKAQITNASAASSSP